MKSPARRRLASRNSGPNGLTSSPLADRHPSRARPSPGRAPHFPRELPHGAAVSEAWTRTVAGRRRVPAGGRVGQCDCHPERGRRDLPSPGPRTTAWRTRARDAHAAVEAGEHLADRIANDACEHILDGRLREHAIQLRGKLRRDRSSKRCHLRVFRSLPRRYVFALRGAGGSSRRRRRAELIVIGERESFDAIAADSHIYSDVQLESVREGQQRAKMRDHPRSAMRRAPAISASPAPTTSTTGRSSPLSSGRRSRSPSTRWATSIWARAATSSGTPTTRSSRRWSS